MKISVMHCCLWLQLMSCVASRVSVEPSVQTVAIGQNATLVCSTPINKFVDWRFRKSGADSVHVIAYKGMTYSGYESKYIPYTDAAGNHVIIANAQIDDSGTYACADDDGFGEVAYAEVNVVVELSTDVSTREPLISDPETEVGTTTITLIVVVPALVILIIVLAVMLLRRSCLSKASEKTCWCYSRTDNPTTTDESLIQKSDCHGKVSVVIEN